MGGAILPANKGERKMKVKRVNSFRYEVEDAKYICIDKHYITNTLSSYELEVKNIHSPLQKDRIKLFINFKTLKIFLPNMTVKENYLPTITWQN